MDRLRLWAAILAVASLTVAVDPLQAQTARSGGSSNANAALLQQLQQVASERTSLQAENEKLKSELADVKKDRDALKAGQQTLDKRARDASAALVHSNTQRESSDQELTQTKAKMQELVAKFRETLQKRREVETEGTTAKQAVATRDRELSTCIDHNVALYHLNDEVLTRLEKQGVWTRVAQAEPFTKIKRIELENDIDDYRARALDQRIAPKTDSGANSPSGVAAPSSPPPVNASPPSTSATPAAAPAAEPGKQ
jgi:chromosome segregation ATPase